MSSQQDQLRLEFVGVVCEWIRKTPVCYHRLNAEVDDFLTQARSEHLNPRVELLPRESQAENLDAQDLLECMIEASDNDWTMPHLMALAEDLEAALREAAPQIESSNRTELMKHAVLAAAFVGGHCARMDSNPTAAKYVWKWCYKASGSGWTPEDIAPLRVFECLSNTIGGGTEIRLDQLNDVARASRAELNICEPDRGDKPDLASCDGDALKLHHRVLLHLTETLATLPAPQLRKPTPEAAEFHFGDWVDKEVLHWFPDDHGFALFHQQRARIFLALGKLDDAREQVDNALRYAKPHMLQSIEASRQMQLTIDLENLSREDITAEVTKKVTEEVTRNATRTIQKQTQKLEQEMSDTARKEREKTSEEIKDALLRVVEILGIFLAVAGIALTSVGGIVVEGSFWDRAVVWGLGYGSIVSLFWLLRRIAGLSGLHVILKDRRKSKAELATQPRMDGSSS